MKQRLALGVVVLFPSLSAPGEPPGALEPRDVFGLEYASDPQIALDGVQARR